LAIMGVCAAAHAVVVLSDKGLPKQQDVWDRTDLPAKMKERVSDMLGDRRHQEAIQTLRNYLRYYPQNGDMRRLLGKVLFDSGRYDEARNAYYAALLNDPEDFVARNNMGVVLMKQGRGEDALREFKDAFDASGQEAFIAANLAICHERTGNSAEAASLRDMVSEGGSGELTIPEDALMLADAETVRKLRAGKKTAAERP